MTHLPKGSDDKGVDWIARCGGDHALSEAF
jgi:hypothetical protein